MQNNANRISDMAQIMADFVLGRLGAMLGIMDDGNPHRRAPMEHCVRQLESGWQQLLEGC